MSVLARPHRNGRLSVLLGIIALDLLAGTSLASAATWNGGTGDFGTAANWNLHSVPGSADTATVNSGAAAVTTSQTVGTVNIGGTGTVSVSGSGALQVTTLKVNAGGTLDIGSGLAVTAGATTIAGTVQGDGTLNAGAATQSGGTLDVETVTATTYTLKGDGQITGGEVGFSDSFTLQVGGEVASGVDLTGGGSATMTQSGDSTMAGTVTGITGYTQSGNSVMSGSVTTGTYTQSGGTMSGAVDTTDYKLSGGSIDDAVLDDATVDYTGAFTMSGNSTIGASTVITGGPSATFTQTNGTMSGSASVYSYTQSGGTVAGAVETTDYKLSGGSINGTVLDPATVDFTGDFTMSGSSTIGANATITGDEDSTFTQTNDLSTMSGSVSVGSYTQQAGKVQGAVETTDYTLKGGSIDGTELQDATVGFAGTFAMSGKSSIGVHASITGESGSTFTQSNELSTMSGSVSVDTYAQQGGTMAGSAEAADYKLTGGTINGTALDAATVEFTHSFLLAGNSELGVYSSATGVDDATFTQNNGHMRGTVEADSYELTGGQLEGAATVDSFVLANEGGDLVGQIVGSVNFTSTFDMSGNTVIAEDATVTGEADSIFTHEAGTIAGNVSVGTYAINACFVDECAAVADTATIDASKAFDVSLDSGTVELAGKLTGSGELKKSGASTLILANDANDYTGATTVTDGVLQVDGAITASAATVSGGTLAGTGSLGAVTIEGGGTHMAGDAGSGSQTIDGSYVNHGTLAVELTPETAGKVVVDGTVDITGATLDLRQLTGSGWSARTDFTIIDNEGDDGVAGSFASIESAYAFLVPGVSTDGGDGNDVVLTLLRNDVGFSQVGATGNQRATAGAIESLGAGNPIHDGILWLTDKQAQQAFADLSGESFASTKGALLSTAVLTSDVLLDRTGLAFGALGAADPSGYAPVDPLPGDDSSRRLWTAAYGAWRQTDADAGIAATNGSAAGIVAGLDTELAGWTLGLAAGAGQSGMAVPELGSDIHSTDLMLGAYAGSRWDALELALGASYTRHLLSSRRDLDFPDPQVLTADYAAGTAQVFGRIGAPIDLGAVDLTPFAEASYARLDTDAMAETGGSAALSSEASTTDAAMARLGVSASTSRHIGDGMLLRISADAAWQHGSGDAPTADNSFVSGSDGFTVHGVPLASDFLAAGLGLDLDVSERLQLRLDYGGEFADGAQNHKLSAEIAGAF